MGTTVLVADPDRDLRDIYTHALGKAGLAVHAVASGEEAVSWAAKHRPGLVILALNLGGALDGFETIRKFRGDARTDGIPLIVVSTRDRPEDRARAYEAGADFYFIKPAELQRLVQFVDSLLARDGTTRILRERPREGESMGRNLEKGRP